MWAVHESLLPGMEVNLISSAAHSRCHSLPPSIMFRLILLETVPNQVITKASHASWEQDHDQVSYPPADEEVQPAYHYATVFPF